MTRSSTIGLKDDWKILLSNEFKSDYFKALNNFLLKEKEDFVLFPPDNLIFSAFNRTSFNKVKVIIVGQDPYHGIGQANGLAFSVSEGVKIPPSLKNIFKEIFTDIGIPIPQSGNLEPWADQGVLLMNTTLTVRNSQPGSHQKRGWERFTNTVISTLSKERTGLVFLLWGNQAKEKEQLIDLNKHYVLKAAHPSPFSAYNGFFGCKHFSKTNEILRSQELTEIDWKIEPVNSLEGKQQEMKWDVPEKHTPKQ